MGNLVLFFCGQFAIMGMSVTFNSSLLSYPVNNILTSKS